MAVDPFSKEARKQSTSSNPAVSETKRTYSPLEAQVLSRMQPPKPIKLMPTIKLKK